MSYDLYFFKHKSNPITTQQIGEYLSENLISNNEPSNQWVFENEDTGVYYSFEVLEPEEDAENDELSESFNDFEETHISFNVNFIRPGFFGLEAFAFVEKFINDLDLFVMNPQGEDDKPIKPSKDFLFDNWNKTNLWASKEHAGENYVYYPQEQSNAIWNYNYNRKNLQAQIGEEYFVSKIFFFEEQSSGNAVTLSMWSEHIPNVLPITDYYLLGRRYRKLFKTVKDTVLLTKEEFNSIFETYFEPYTVPNTIIIHPDKAASAAKLFNSVKSDLQIEKHLFRVASEMITNVVKE
jgi:hypothetical protein